MLDRLDLKDVVNGANHDRRVGSHRAHYAYLQFAARLTRRQLSLTVQQYILLEKKLLVSSSRACGYPLFKATKRPVLPVSRLLQVNFSPSSLIYTWSRLESYVYYGPREGVALGLSTLKLCSSCSTRQLKIFLGAESSNRPT